MSGDLELPTLTMYWRDAPDFVVSVMPSGAGDGNGNASPVPNDINVMLGTVRAAEEDILQAASTIVDRYTSLKGTFEGEKDWVYGQQAEMMGPKMVQGFTPNSPTTFELGIIPDPVQQMAVHFADGSDGNPGINDIQAETLKGIADCMALVGEFVVAVQNSGLAYAGADYASVFPSAGNSGT